MLAFLDKIPFGTPLLRRIVFWLITTFSLYLIVGFFILPPAVKSVLIKQATVELNRTTTIDDIWFNPLTMDIEVVGFKVAKLEGEGNLVSVESFTAAPGIATIWKLAPVISYLHLRNLSLDITFYGEGKYSISDILNKSNQEKTQEEEAEAGTVFPFALYGFELTDSKITIDDRTHDKTHVIEKLNLLVPFTSSFLDLRKEFTEPQFNAVVNGDPIVLKGRTLPFDDTLLTEFELGATEVDLDQYWRYVPLKSPMKLIDGQFTSDISIFFERPEAERINLFFGGGGTFTNLEFDVPGDGKVLAVKELTFEMEKLSLGDNELVLTNLVMNEPYVKVIRTKASKINWAGYFPKTELTETGATIQSKEEDSGINLDLRNLEINDGSLEWHDKTVKFRRVYPHFTFKGSKFTTLGGRPSEFTMTIGKDGLLKVVGATSRDPLSAKLGIDLKELPIPLYKPYLDAYFPMAVDSGTLDAYIDLDMQQAGEELSLSLANGSLSLSDIALRKPNAKEPSITLAKFEMSGGSLDLGAKNIVIEEVRLTDPSAKVVRMKSGKVDLAELFASDEKKVEKEGERVAAEDWTATINAVRMTGGAASVKDYTLKEPANLSIDGLKVDLDNITTRQGASMDYDISTRWGRKGIISLKGKAGLDTLKTSGRLRVKRLGLRPFDGHLGEQTELLFASGSASADLKYQISAKGTPKYIVSGNASLDKVQLKDNRGDGEFAGIDAFKLAGIRVANEPNRLSIANIHLDGPRAAIDINEKGELNIRRAFRIPEPKKVTEASESKETKPKKKTASKDKKKKEKAAETKPAPVSNPTPFETIDIGKVSMENGRVSYRDASVNPVYYTVISDMKLNLVEVAHLQTARPKVDFSAKIGPTPMSITGVVNPVITPIYSDLAIAVNGLEMVPLTPYTLQYLAYPVEKGRLYADVTFKTEDWVLTANNKFFIEQLVMGAKDKRPDAPSVPVKFGLSLLQDNNGDMELNLPVRGRLDDPDFRIGGIVFKAIASLFIKALASPFTLIGSVFGGGGEDMDFVVFQPGRHTIDPAGMKKLETTVRALTEREKLKLEVDGVIDPAVDKRGLVEVKFENKMKQAKYNSLSRKERGDTTVEAMVVTPEEYEEVLFDVYKEEPDPEGIKPTTLFVTDRQPIDFMEKFIIERIEVTDKDLNELAMLRATAVKELIIRREPSLTQRVYLLDRRQDKTGKTGVPQHRADLAIK